MTQDEIIEMARDSGMELYGLGKDRARFVHHLEAFAKLVAAKERERIIAKNAPELEKVNAYIKRLEEALATKIRHRYEDGPVALSLPTTTTSHD